LLTQTFDTLSTESVLANTTTGIFETLFVDKLAAFRVSPCHLTHAVNRVIQTPPYCLPTDDTLHFHVLRLSSLLRSDTSYFLDVDDSIPPLSHPIVR
jgi:hypothetical protein